MARRSHVPAISHLSGKEGQPRLSPGIPRQAEGVEDARRPRVSSHSNERASNSSADPDSAAVASSSCQPVVTTHPVRDPTGLCEMADEPPGEEMDGRGIMDPNRHLLGTAVRIFGAGHLAVQVIVLPSGARPLGATFFVCVFAVSVVIAVGGAFLASKPRDLKGAPFAVLAALGAVAVYWLYSDTDIAWWVAILLWCPGWIAACFLLTPKSWKVWQGAAAALSCGFFVSSVVWSGTLLATHTQVLLMKSMFLAPIPFAATLGCYAVMVPWRWHSSRRRGLTTVSAEAAAVNVSDSQAEP